MEKIEVTKLKRDIRMRDGPIVKEPNHNTTKTKNITKDLSISIFIHDTNY